MYEILNKLRWMYHSGEITMLVDVRTGVKQGNLINFTIRLRAQEVHYG